MNTADQLSPKCQALMHQPQRQQRHVGRYRLQQQQQQLFQHQPRHQPHQSQQQHRLQQQQRRAVSSTAVRHRSVVGCTQSLPAVAFAYNRNMNFVDKTNRLTALRTPYRKSSRWVVTVIIHLIKVATANKWILYRAVGGRRSYAAFFGELALRLLALRKRSNPRGLWATAMVPVVAQQSQSKATAAVGSAKRGRCAVCKGGGWDNKRNTDTGADARKG